MTTRMRISPISEMAGIKSAANRLDTLADPTRLAIVMMLAEKLHNVGAISTAMGCSQPAISHHLSILRLTGVVDFVREGKNSVYHLTEAGADLLAAVRPLFKGDAS